MKTFIFSECLFLASCTAENEPSNICPISAEIEVCQRASTYSLKFNVNFFCRIFQGLQYLRSFPPFAPLHHNSKGFATFRRKFPNVLVVSYLFSFFISIFCFSDFRKNFWSTSEGLALGWIEAAFCKQRFVWQHCARSTRFAHFCNAKLVRQRRSLSWRCRCP